MSSTNSIALNGMVEELVFFDCLNPKSSIWFSCWYAFILCNRNKLLLEIDRRFGRNMLTKKMKLHSFSFYNRLSGKKAF